MIIAASDLAALISRRVQEATDRQVVIMTSGSLPDYPAYRESVGYLTAMGEMRTLLTELMKTRGELA